MWDTDLGKYIEESNIYAVELTNRWWNDPSGQTMPSIAPAYRGANDGPGGPPGPRRDGWVRILDYDHDKQAWENADVNDYALTGGEKKDRRWAEGSSTIKRYYGPGGRKAVYYLTYSANNWETPQYGVGYATSDSPLGPFRKSPTNPILSQNAQIGMYSTGHGSFASSPDGRQLYYVHHGRPSPEEPQRRLYTERAFLRPPAGDPFGVPTLSIDQATSDRPIPSGVAPYALRSSSAVRCACTPAPRRASPGGSTAPTARRWPSGTRSTACGRPWPTRGSRRCRTTATTPGAWSRSAPGRTTLTLTYQRRLANGTYYDVYNFGRWRQPVKIRIPIVVIR